MVSKVVRKAKRKAGRPRGSARVGRNVIDRAWFFERMAERTELGPKGMSLRKLAGLMGVDVGGLSRLLHGKRRLSVDEAADLARILRQPYEEVVRRANVEASPGTRVKLVGIVDSEGLVKPADRDVTRAPSSSACAAVQVQAPGSPVDGWVMYFNPAKSVEAEAVGRLAIVTVSGQRRLVRVLSRGAVRGTWALASLWSPGQVEETVLESAAPVLEIRC